MFDLTRFVKAPKNKKDLFYLRKKYYNGVIALANAYNGVISFFNRRKLAPSGSRELDEIRRHSLIRTDISDHLETLYEESLSVNPKLIVELGVGPGHSTFVFERVAKICGARLVSVDLAEGKKSASSWSDWIFVNKNDIEFAKEFSQWAKGRGIEPAIDILFIDTSHKYEHTLQEIEGWFPYLSRKAKVFFHDTNVRPIYRRRDGTIGLAYDIKRGVIRALETYFGKSFNEKRDFTDFCNGWSIRHYSLCNGLTILTRQDLDQAADTL